MSTVVVYNARNTRPYQQGLGLRLFGKKITWRGLAAGLLRRAGSKLAAFIEMSVPIIGKEAGDFIESQINGLADKVEGTDTTLQARIAYNDITQAENNYLSIWLDNNLAPFLQKLSQEIGFATNLKGQAQVDAINAVLNKLNAIQAHFDSYKAPQLSTNAHTYQQALIYEMLKNVLTVAEEVLKRSGLSLEKVEVQVPFNQYSYAPLITSSSIAMVTGENYRIKSVGSGTAPTTTGGITKNPISLNPGSSNSLTPGVITLPASANAAGQPNNTKRTGLWIAAGAFAAVAIYAFTRKPKKAKK